MHNTNYTVFLDDGFKVNFTGTQRYLITPVLWMIKIRDTLGTTSLGRRGVKLLMQECDSRGGEFIENVSSKNFAEIDSYS